MIGMIIYNMPYTTSTFSGSHSYYNGAVQCTKCHDVDIEIHTGTTDHNNFTCESCHRSEPGIRYQSKGISGNEAHAASRSACSNCHNSTVPMAGPVTNTTPWSMCVVADNDEWHRKVIENIFN